MIPLFFVFAYNVSDNIRNDQNDICVVLDDICGIAIEGTAVFFFEHYGLQAPLTFRHFTLRDTDFPRHFHRAYELVTVEAGQLTLTVDAHEWRLTPGQAALVFPNQLHAFTHQGSTVIKITIFAPELINDFSTSHRDLVPDDNRLTGADLTARWGLETAYAQKAWLYQLLAQFDPQRAYRPRVVSSRQQLLFKTLAFIETHFRGECTLRLAATTLGYDYTYLSRTFSGLLGLSFTAYVTDYRLLAASTALRETTTPIAEIAATCGFGSVHYFNQSFKTSFNQTPSAYRRVH